MTNRKIVSFRSMAGGVVLAVALFTFVGAAPAFAQGVWWGVTSDSWPAVLPSGGEGAITVFAENFGDTRVASGEVSVTDRLPAGVTSQSVKFFVTPYNNALTDIGGNFCTITGQEVACRLPESVLPNLPFNPYDALEMHISVKVEGAVSGVENEATVSSSGTSPVSVKRPLEIGSTPAPFGVSNHGLAAENLGGSVDTQAGSHPFQLTSTLTINQTADPARPPALAKDLYFKLPPGLIGNPTAVAQCTSNQFATVTGSFPQQINACPNNTAVGVAAITFDEPYVVSQSGNPATIAVPLFNLTPAVGEPARFGFLVASTPVILDTSVRTGGDYGVTVTVKNVSELVSFIASHVTFWGVPGDPSHDNSRGWGCIRAGEYVRLDAAPPCTALNQPKPPPFLALPTSCTGPLQTTVESDSWSTPNVLTAPVRALGETALDGCNRLPFSSTISVAPDALDGSTATGLTVGVHVPQDEALNGAGLAPADVKNTTVALPAGVALNPSGADGLLACSEEQVALQTHTVPACPEASKVGTVEIQTPLLPNALMGAAYLAAQNANPFGSLVALYLVARDPVSGTLVKVAGEVKPDPITGQLVSTFLNTPQLPFEDLRLHFFGGERAPLATPARCGSYTTNASFAPWSGNEPVSSSSTFDITSGPHGSPCPGASLPFSPSLTGGALNIQAGAFSPFTATFSRSDGEQNIQAIEAKLPPGLSGILAGVELCREPHADLGECPANSLIGESTVSVGVGSHPFTVSGGKFYLTGPYRGAPFGITFEVPAKAGPFDLRRNSANPAGENACDCVIVRAKIEIDPITAAITITSDPPGSPYAIPTSIEGIPLQIQHVNATTTRGNFQFNPTNCNKLEVTGTIDTGEGPAHTLSVPFQVTNCATLKFAPKFSVLTSGKTSRANGASLHVKLTYPNAPFGSQANIARVKVDLPKQLPSRLTTLQKACTAAQFALNPANCPKESFIGHAKAITPLIPVPLEGPAIFVSHGGEAFPSLIIVLQGYGVTIDLVGSTFISKAGITSSTFKTVPDQPIGSFELTLPQGKFSALAANGNLCKSKLAMPTEFLAQNGAKINESTKISVTGCKKVKKSSKHHKTKRNGKKRKKK